MYFLPAAPEVYNEAEVPRHPALRLVANSEQVLSSRYSRRLITMRKVLEALCVICNVCKMDRQGGG